jgi:SAM-dependent methyltransferase
MKVGTDAVLLGAWANIEESYRIVDAGCGSGIIALMAAQRNTRAFVTGLEIDSDAAEQATENCAASQYRRMFSVLVKLYLIMWFAIRPFTPGMLCPKTCVEKMRDMPPMAWMNGLKWHIT